MFGRRRKGPEQHREAAEPTIAATVFPSETAARQAASGSPEELNRLGLILKLGGRADEAAEIFRQAAEAGSHDAMANLASYYSARGRNREAAAWYRRAGGPLGEALAESLDAKPDA